MVISTFPPQHSNSPVEENGTKTKYQLVNVLTQLIKTWTNPNITKIIFLDKYKIDGKNAAITTYTIIPGQGVVFQHQ